MEENGVTLVQYSSAIYNELPSAEGADKSRKLVDFEGFLTAARKWASTNKVD